MSESTPTIWLTRPADQATELLAQTQQVLDAQSLQNIWHVKHTPLFKIQPIATSIPQNNFSGIIFISKNAVLHCPKLMDANIPLYAVGPVTAQALSDSFAGCLAKTPPHDFSSEGLLSLPELQQVDGQSWLIVRGKGGRETLKATLQKRGAIVHYCECYTRQTIALPANLHTSPHDVWVVSSAATLQALSADLTRLQKPLQSKLRNSPLGTLIVSSNRLATQAHALGWHNVKIAKNATNNALSKQISATLAELADELTN